MRKERFIIIMAMLFFSITSAVALEIQMSCRPISTTTNGPRRMPSNNNVTLSAHYNEFSGELHFAYSAPGTFFTYYVYNQSGVSVVRNTNSISVNLGTNDMARITTYNPISGEVQSYIGNSTTMATTNPGETIVCISGHNRIPFIQNPDVLYIQNTNITGTLDENHDVIKVGNHVTTSMATGDVTTSNANITLRANEILLDSGTYISVGSTLKTVNP